MTEPIPRARVRRVPASPQLVKLFGLPPFHWEFVVPQPLSYGLVRELRGVAATHAEAFASAMEFHRKAWNQCWCLWGPPSRPIPHEHSARPNGLCPDQPERRKPTRL